MKDQKAMIKQEAYWSVQSLWEMIDASSPRNFDKSNENDESRKRQQESFETIDQMRSLLQSENIGQAMLDEILKAFEKVLN